MSKTKKNIKSKYGDKKCSKFEWFWEGLLDFDMKGTIDHFDLKGL